MVHWGRRYAVFAAGALVSREATVYSLNNTVQRMGMHLKFQTALQWQHHSKNIEAQGGAQPAVPPAELPAVPPAVPPAEFLAVPPAELRAVPHAVPPAAPPVVPPAHGLQRPRPSPFARMAQDPLPLAAQVRKIAWSAAVMLSSKPIARFRWICHGRASYLQQCPPASPDF